MIPKFSVGQTVRVVSKEEFIKLMEQKYKQPCSTLKKATLLYTRGTTYKIEENSSFNVRGKIVSCFWVKDLNTYAYNILESSSWWEEEFLIDPLQDMLEILKI